MNAPLVYSMAFSIGHGLGIAIGNLLAKCWGLNVLERSDGIMSWVWD